MRSEIEIRDLRDKIDAAPTKWTGSGQFVACIREASFFDGNLLISEVHPQGEENPTEYICEWNTGIPPICWNMAFFPTIEEALHCANEHRHEVAVENAAAHAEVE